MKTIHVRGRTLGGASPLVCAPLVGATASRLLAEARAVLRKKPDVVEWRVDHFRAVADTGAVIDTGRELRRAIGDTPLIFTCRSAREGGERQALRVDGVVRLYAAVSSERLADFIDFEMANDVSRVRQVIEDAHRRKVRVILSSHDFKRTPSVDTLLERFLRAEKLGGDVAKVAVMPRNDRDVLVLLQALSQAYAKSRIPLIGLSMGPLGAVTRLVGGRFGSALGFAMGAGSSAPGQPPIADLRAAFELLERTAPR